MEDYLEDHHRGPFPNDEAFAIRVKRPRRLLGVIVVASGQAARSCEPSDGQGMDARLGSASQHDIGIAAGNEASSIADRMSACGACRRCRMIRSLRS